MDKKEFNELLGKYADVILHTGVNLQKGQRLSLFADIQNIQLVRLMTARAYQMGASLVDVGWVDEKLIRTRFDYADPETLSIVPDWGVRREEEYGERGDASVYIVSRDPDLLEGVSAELIAAYRKSISQKYEPTFKYIDKNLINWNVVAVATPAWAKKVFPGIPLKQAQEKLWDAIFKACRINKKEPVQAWKEHSRNLHKRSQYMNEKKYVSLHYRAPGTDLTVEFPENNIWCGGSVATTTGIEFFPNMPTEEIFTMPHKDKVNGFVSWQSHQGNC
jgi:aminopeptidase